MTRVPVNLCRTLRSLWHDRSGAITLEASMVLPWIMILTFVVMLFALFVSQSTVLYYSTSVAAERAAFSWSNSAQDMKTGAYPQGHYDGLYWRLTDDALLQGLLGIAMGNGNVEVTLTTGASEASGTSVADKLARIGSMMPGAVSGEAAYRNLGIKRTISVHASSSRLPNVLTNFGLKEPATADVTALVVEPTEVIRTFDLVRYYTAKMRKSPQGEASFRDQAAKAILRRSSL